MSTTEEEQFDVLIVGAGFSGIHQLIQLRAHGLRCVILEAGADLGGTWYWNTYPGARVDSHVPMYELPLPALWRDWTWSERFPGWAALQAYFTYVGEKMTLRPHCRFETVVREARWDDREHRWHVVADARAGRYQASARHLILCTGATSKPYMPELKGRETFAGPSCHTSRWPSEGIELAGRRVGVIGTGASGIQVIQEIAAQVARLTVFQRAPHMAVPMQQCRISKEAQDNFKPAYDVLYEKMTTTFGGILIDHIPRPMLSDTPKEREANFERMWEMGGFSFLLNNYQDMLTDRTSNDIAYEFWRRKVSERIKDPEKCAILAPKVPPYPIGAKRLPLEQHYYETFNQDNVDLVDLKSTPILEIYDKGVRTSNKEYELDVLIFATGFDGFVGGINAIDLRGLNGKTIQDHWRDGVTTYLGMTIDDFPNLFFMYGPQGPTVLCNGPTCARVQGTWITDTIVYVRERGITKIVPTREAALAFKEHVNVLCDATLVSEAESWYMGANVPGKKREAYNYFGGLVAYTQEITQEKERGYPGFVTERLAPA